MPRSLPLPSRRALVVAAAAAVGVWGLAAGVQAHAFLAATQPAHGERLDQPPGSVALQFSEPVSRNGARVAVERDGGEAVETAAPVAESDGRVLRVGLPPLDPGVYVVSFHVASAVDGHETAGELAFAVQPIDAQVPAPRDRPEPGGWWPVAAAWAWFVGVAAAAGGLVGPRLLPAARRVGGRLDGRLWLRAGLSLATLAALGEMGAAVWGPTPADGAAALLRAGVAAHLLVALLAAAGPFWLPAPPLVLVVLCQCSRSRLIGHFPRPAEEEFSSAARGKWGRRLVRVHRHRAIG